MKKQAMTEGVLISQIEHLERQSSGYFSSEIATEQAMAMDYYLRRPFGTEEEGRSAVISSDVWDVVEGLTPVVLKPFVSTDDIVRFNPEGAEDEEAAEQESDYMNYIITQKNDVFSTLASWVKTGLLQKNGIVKYWWDKSRKSTIERYEGISDDLYAALLQEEGVTVLEHTERMDEGLNIDPATGQQIPPENQHDVVLRVSSEYGEAKYCVIPPEEFLINKDASSPNPQKATFVEHRTRKTLSDIRAMGYDVEDDISGESNGTDPRYSEQFNSRNRNEDMVSAGDSHDPSGREVVFREIFINVDFDGDGISELRKICIVGSTILLNEETEEIPFCAWTPYQQPFKFYGRCPADETTEIQLTKSVLWRQNLDNIYTINNNRVFASEGVNLYDLLDNQIAGVVRVKGDVVSNHVMTAPISPIGGVIQPMIEYLDSAKENRTGFTRYNQGSDSDSLNKTATGIRIIAEAGNERVNLISRSFAELGLKPLMLGLHGLCRRHATKEETVRLRGKWVTINPRNWKTRYDMSVSVGLGNSDMQMKMQAAQLMLDRQEKLMPSGIVKPENLYNAAKKLAEAVGEKNPDKYFTSPVQKDGSPQPEDPAIAKQQLEEIGAALEDAMKQIETLKSDKDIKHRELDIKKSDSQFKQSQVAPQQDPNALGQTAIAVAKINAESAERIAMINASAGKEEKEEEAEELDEMGEPIVKIDPMQVMIQAMLESNQQIMQMMAANMQPKTSNIQIKKQPDGSFVGQKIEE